MESHTLKVSFGAQRSKATGGYEIVPESRGKTYTLHATHLQLEDISKTPMGPIPIIEVHRDEKMPITHDLLCIPTILSIIESYEPLTVFSSLNIWKRNTIYHDEMIRVLGEVSHDCKTFEHILGIFKYCTSIWINAEKDTVPIDFVRSEWFREQTFCRVAAYGTYESYEALGRIVFPGESFPKRTRGGRWRREVLNKRMEIKDETLPPPVTLAAIISNVDVDTFASIYPPGSHMEQDVFISLMMICIRNDSPHLYHLAEFFRGMPRYRVRLYLDSKSSETDMEKCIEIWKEFKEAEHPIPIAISKIGDHFCSSLRHFVGWEKVSHFSNGATVRCKEMVNAHKCYLLRSQDMGSREVVKSIRDIVITCFCESARDDADRNISLLVAHILLKFYDGGAGQYTVLKSLIENGFLMEDDIPRIIHLEKDWVIIVAACEMYGPDILNSIILTLCERIGYLVLDAKQRETETCYLISHLRHAFILSPESVKASTADRVFLAIAKYMIVYKGHNCENNVLLDSFHESVQKYIRTGEEGDMGLVEE